MQTAYKYRYYFFQCWGILLLVVIVWGNLSLDYWQMNSVAVSLGGLAVIANVLLFKRFRIFNFMLLLSAVTSMVFAGVRTLFPVTEDISTTIVLSICLFFHLLLVYRFEDRIRAFFSGRYFDFKLSMFRNNVLYEFFRVSKALLYLVSIYTAVLIVSNAYFLIDGYPKLYRFFNYDLNVILWVLFFLYEVGRVRLIHSRLIQENWLPIITEDLQTVGRIAESESRKNGNKHLHPHIRIAVIQENKIYLQFKSESLLSAGRADVPISGDLLFGESLEQAIGRLVYARFPVLNERQIRPRFVVYNRFTSETADRIVFHYVLEVDQELLSVLSPSLPEGKVWLLSQIRENLGQARFSDCFEDELPLLENYLTSQPDLVCRN